MSIHEYDVLGILGNNINSTTYKVKHKKTGNILTWHTIDYSDMSSPEKEQLLDRIRSRSDICHPNIMKFFKYIDEEERKTIYVVTEYIKNGSLKNLIDSCSSNNTRLSEEFVCKILYQVAVVVKTLDSCIGKLTTKNIFLDEDFNIKLLNFNMDYKCKIAEEGKMYHLGYVLYEICSRKPFDEDTYVINLKQLGNFYSFNMLALIKCLVNKTHELKTKIHEVLGHRTVLLKSARWMKNESFINIDNLKNSPSKPTKERKTDYTSKLDKLRKKEAYLQAREQELNEREYKLIIREKKIMLMERSVKEKLQQAEIYLKRCKESKSVSSDSRNSTISKRKQNKMCYENLDSTYVSCGESILQPTSSKLDVNKIIKPAPFTRTLSERRIRFKGHSPLKEVDFNRRRLKQPKSLQCVIKKKSDWLTCSEDTDKSSVDGSLKCISNKAKKLFPEKNTYENGSLENGDVPCQPIVWTKESKKYAFELLKVMNGDKENQCVKVKHTYL